MNEIITNWVSKTREFLFKPKIRALMQILLAICFVGLVSQAFAGDDILGGTDATLLGTINGTGKKYILMAEGFLSLAMYIKTKNLLVLFGIIVVSVFINIVLKVAA